MPTETELIKERKRNIKADDNQDTINIAQLMAGAQGEVERQLKYFRDRYAVRGVLSISEMRTNPNQADLRQWQRFIQKYGTQLMADEEGKYRLDKARKRAGIDRNELLSQMVGLSIAYATVNVNKYMAQKQTSEANSTYTFHNALIQADHKNAKNLANDVQKKTKQFIGASNYGLTTDQHSWLRTDKLTADVNNAINRGLQAGLDDDYYNKHLFNSASTGNYNSVPALFTSASNYQANSLLRQRKALIVGVIDSYMAIQNHQTQAFWQTVGDNHVCKTCEGLAQGSPYARDKVPPQPHNGCRCFVVYK
ncbi:hypothetical protein IWT140_01717 [Secundilactobacillus pentosiphilus]|uniref:Phage Mu protein F like protein n=1 Tax=Secundilactobacillus pentosiphilus TaxID=1714682 RepID=A0A1Z5IQS5_9LACO|nr:hypothetical protein [Secundilactobacillus pentosiphilus]GAX04080.1 hypothetical protein IWT140_01717 [Secundilactobacillus pentosiphilus]